MILVNALKLRETKQRLNATLEDTSKQAIISAVAASIYVLDRMEMPRDKVLEYFDNMVDLYALPDDIFGKQANDYDVMKIISEKFPEVDFQKMYPLLKVKIE